MLNNFAKNFVSGSILLMSITFLLSCKENVKRKEVGQKGIVEVSAVRRSKNHLEYLKAAQFLQDDKLPEAISIYKKLCTIEDDSLKTFPYMGLGSAYAISGNYKNAIESFQRSIELDSQNTESYVGLGSAYFRLKDYYTAIKCYSKAKAIDSNNSNCYWGLTLSYDKLQMTDSAKINARRFIELEPDSKYRYLAENILNK